MLITKLNLAIISSSFGSSWVKDAVELFSKWGIGKAITTFSNLVATFEQLQNYFRPFKSNGQRGRNLRKKKL